MPNKQDCSFKVVGVCFRCGYELTQEELENNWVKGWSHIECDCPLCGHTLEPMLRVINFHDLSVRASVFYFDPLYLKWRLQQLLKTPQHCTAFWQRKHDPALFWNVINYYSTMQAALNAAKQGKLPRVSSAAA